MSAVTKMHEQKVALAAATASSVAAPALGFSLQFDLGAGRVATLQTFLPNDCAVAQLNDMLDKMTLAGDRQRAHYKIEELERTLETELNHAAQAAEDLRRIEVEHDAKQIERMDAMEKQQRAVDGYVTKAQEAHVTSGRRGTFQMRPADKSHYDTLMKSVASLKEDFERADAERAAQMASIEVTKKRRAEIIQRTKDEIARCRAIVGGRLNTE